MAREFGDDDAGPPFESASPPGTVSDTPSPARGVPPAGPAPVTESFAASEDDYVTFAIPFTTPSSPTTTLGPG